MNWMTPMTPTRLPLAALAAVLALSIVPPAVPADADRQQPFIATLASDAPPAAKAIACKRLALYGDKAAVPALAPLLANPELASWARIALEAIPDAEAADALRAATGTLKGPLRIGVINSLGARRDAASVGTLTNLLADADADVASAAAAALGRVGGPAAVAALASRLRDAPVAVRPAVAEGCLVCAARLLAAGAYEDAARMYDAVRGLKVSAPLTVEATRGLILARRTGGVPLLVEQLRSEDKDFFRIGLRTARELPGDDVTRALLAELPGATPERQPYVMLALADRGDARAQPVALQAARDGPPRLRVAAIAVLERLVDPASLPVLLAAAADADKDVAGASRTALARWPGADVDSALLAALRMPEEAVRRTAMELIGQRQVRPAIPLLLQVAGEPDGEIRLAALKVLGDLAGAAEVPALVDLLMKSGDTSAVEGALRSIGARSAGSVSGRVTVQKAVYGRLPEGPAADVTAKVGSLVKSGARAVEATNRNFGDPAGGIVKKLRIDYAVNGVPCQQTVEEGETLTLVTSAVPPEVVDPVCAALANAPVGAQPALLRLLRAFGGPKALAAVRAASIDAGSALRETSLRLLCEWPTADALPDLVRLARGPADATIRTLALRGAIRLAQRPDVPAVDRLATLREAMALAGRDDERRLVLSALGELASVDSLALVIPLLASESLKEEAGLAAVSISERLSPPRPAQVAAAMERVAGTTANEDLAKRARAISGR
jgi:HEAT repeat protein